MSNTPTDPSAPANQFFTDNNHPGDKPQPKLPIRCICGDTNEKAGSEIQYCKDCHTWQHAKCMCGPAINNVSEVAAYANGWSCWNCSPERHFATIEALRKGEKIWETRWQMWNYKASPAGLRGLPMPEITVSSPGQTQSQPMEGVSATGAATPAPTITSPRKRKHTGSPPT